MQGWYKKGVFWFIFKKPNTANKVKSVYFVNDTVRIIDSNGTNVLVSDFDYKIKKVEIYKGIKSSNDFESVKFLKESSIEDEKITFSSELDYVDIAFLVYVNTQEVCDGRN